MITQAEIDETCVWSPLRMFGAFVLEHVDPARAGNGLPDYATMDLMRIPSLVPHIWVYDLRTPESREGLLVNFSGARHDEVLETPTMGRFDAQLEEKGVLLSRMVREVKSAIERQMVLYTRKHFEILAEPEKDVYAKASEALGYGTPSKFRYSETLLFPCSSDGETVNWSIACAHFEIRDDVDDDDVYRHF